MQGPHELETERTFLRKLTADDAENFYQLNLDPAVLAYTGDKPFDSIASAESFLANYDQYIKYGVGRLGVIEKSTGHFIGWCGLKYSPDTNEYDIGFRFFRSYWNKGFATETAMRCIQHGLHDLQLPEIIGRAMKDNTASIKVLEKLGMKCKGNFDFDGQEGVLYSITKFNSSIRM